MHGILTRHAVLLFLATSVGACASKSGGGGAGVPRDETLVVRGDRITVGMNTRRDVDVRVDTIDAPAQRLFDVLPGVMTALNLRTSSVDKATMNVATSIAQFRYTFDGQRISRYLTCGSSAAGNNADLYFVNIRVQSWAERLGDSTGTLNTVIRATAHPADNGSASSINCASTGRLEARVRQLVAINAIAKR